MRFLAAFGLLTSCAPAACATPQQENGGRCDTGSLESIMQDPVAFDGKIYCGPAYVRRRGHTVHILAREDEEPGSDLALLVTTSGWSLLGEPGSAPRRYYIEARLELQSDCFGPSRDDDETCSPFRRPVLVHLRAARPLAR